MYPLAKSADSQTTRNDEIIFRFRRNSRGLHGAEEGRDPELKD